MIQSDLECKPLLKDGNEDYKIENDKDDKYTWDRFIKNLVKLGFGDYKTAASANLVDAVVFLYLEDDKEARLYKHLYGGKQ